MKAIDVIELARTYFLFSNDRSGSKPIMVGGRVKLEMALEGIKSDMVIATTGNDKKCIVLMDFTTEEVITLAHRVNNKILRIKSVN